MMTVAPNNGFPKPGIRDWTLLGIAVAFVLAGLFILPSDLNVGIVTIAFFGLCATVFAATITRKLRFRRLRPLLVEIVGGVPIRPSRHRALAVGPSAPVLGVVLVAFGRSYGVVFWSIGWFLAAAGCLTLLGLAVGWLPVGDIQIDPAGRPIARRGWGYTIPRDVVSQISGGEIHGNAALFIWLHEPGAVRAHPPERKAQAVKHLAANTRWVGAPVLLLTSQYGMDLPLLMQAVERYVSDPAARAELARKLVTQDA